MGNIKSIIIGTIVTIVVGGTAYHVSQSDIIKNFAEDTGLTQEQAEQYIDKIQKEGVENWSEVGSIEIETGQFILKGVDEIDCINYEYEWESSTLSCSKGKEQLTKFGENAVLLGQSYMKLDLDSAKTSDMEETIRLIDQQSSYFSQFEILNFYLDQSEINEEIKGNSYNKALLKAVLKSIKE